MKNEILEDFRELTAELGTNVERQNGGAAFVGTVTPADAERSQEIGGYVDKETLEITTAAAGFACGERLKIGGLIYRIARVERGILTKIYAVEI